MNDARHLPIACRDGGLLPRRRIDDAAIEPRARLRCRHHIHCAAAVLAIAALPFAATDAATPARGTLYLSTLAGPLYRVGYVYDGAASLVLSTPQQVASLPNGGGVRVGPDQSIYVVGQGHVHRVDPRAGTFVSANAGNNANTVSFDPDGSRLWAGWKDTPLASVPIAPLSAGTTHLVSGDDAVATMVAFTPSHGAFYTTGGELENGNFGRIDMIGFVTQRTQTAAFATGVVYDSFSGHLIVAGVGRARQIAPGNPAVVLSSREDSPAGDNYLVLQADGRGHLFGTRTGGSAQLVMIDYSASGLIGAVDTVRLSVPIPSLVGLSGEAGVDRHAIFMDDFEAAP